MIICMRGAARRATLTVAPPLLALLLSAGSASGRPNIRASFFAAYPNAVGTQLDNLPSISGHCGVCHYAFTGGGPRNLFGQAVEAALPNYPNTDAGRQQAIHSIENFDSDGDGYTNLVEITDVLDYANTPTFPGLNSTNVSQISDVDPNDVYPYLTPTTGVDMTPPTVTVLAPNGTESWTGGTSHIISWIATDNVAVTNVDIFYRDSDSSPWTMLARNIANTGSFSWFVQNTPTTAARVQVLARDATNNSGTDESDNLFTILITPGGIAPTTLRDFHQPGTQPFGGGTFQASTECVTCHGGYDSAVEPGFNFQGTMMGQAARDPLFYACLAIAEQDAPSSGDLCLRCHTPFGWMSGRSQPTSGAELTALDRDGVACDFCHRLVDPDYKAGISPTEDQTVLGALSSVPTNYSNGQYVIDPDPRKRGPFADAIALHPRLYSPFHRTSELCGTCHDVSNPVFDRVSGADYAPGPLDQAATSFASTDILPLERTYSEWKNSAFPAGVYAPDFAGNKADGIVAICQDCHMRDVSGAGCVEVGTPVRADLPLHDLTGGNAWLPNVIAGLYPTETNATALAASSQRAVQTLQKAAALGLTYAIEADSFRALVTVTNRTGHKLPTGYPEGRRMWLHVVARDVDGQTIFESGAYDPATGILSAAPEPKVYEIKLGITPSLAGALGVTAGESFHFTLNDSVWKDNRIPPAGFTNAAFASFGGAPVDPEFPGPGPRYPDGQNWDVTGYPLPANAHSVVAELLYQTTSKDYVEFLHDENTTNTAGQTMYDAWTGNGRSAPVVMERDSIAMSVTGVAEQPTTGPRTHFAILKNPFDQTLDMRVDLARPGAVTMRVFDVRGRLVAMRDFGTVAGGANRLAWDGRNDHGQEVRSGVYWAVVRAGDREWRRQIVRLR
jgi:hypothetical protein